MRTIGKVAGLCLVAMFVMGMTLAGTASAAWEQCSEGSGSTKYEAHQCTAASGTGKWQWSEVTSTEEVRLKGSLKITDTKVPIVGKVAVECSFEAAGYVGPGEHGRITEIKMSAAQCRNVENCEKVEKAEARDLPWQVEQALESTGSGEPGLDIECKVLGITKADECISEAEKPESLNFENRAAGSELFVLATFQNTSKAKCSVGGAGSGETAGNFAVSKTNGAGLKAAFLGLRPQATEIQVALKKTETNNKVIVNFENSYPLRSLTINKEPAAGGDLVSWKISAMQEANVCKTGKILKHGEVCSVSMTFEAGNKAKKEGAGNGYVGLISETATNAGGGTVKLNGEVTN